MRQIWDILQIEPTADKRAIKKAYACRTKEIHPEEKPEEFQVLYEAYQKALRYASLRGKRMPLERGQRAPQEAFPGESIKEKQVPLEAEDQEAAQRQDGYERLGFDSEAARKERARLEEIVYFRSWWRNRLVVWAKNGTVLDEEWKSYLLSEEFREIMWSPIVLEELASGIRRRCLQKEEVLLFFWDLYDLEHPGEEGIAGAGLRLYRLLYPAYTNRMKRQQHEENKEKIKKKENRRIWRLAISIIFVIILLLVIIVVASYAEGLETTPGGMSVGYLLWIVLIFTVWFFWHFIIRG